MNHLKERIQRSLLPNLLDVQLDSYCWFLERGLFEALSEIRDVRDQMEHYEMSLSQKYFKVKCPRLTFLQAKSIKTSYCLRIFAYPYLKNLVENNTRTGKVLLGNIPLMTDHGSFLVNGLERVIINQMVRSPGVYYTKEFDTKKGIWVYTASLIPDRGTWVKFELNDSDGIIIMKMNNVKKFSAHIFLKALGYSDTEILNELDHPWYFEPTMNQNRKINTFEEALIEINSKFRPEEAPTSEGGKNILYSRFFNLDYYDLGITGRYRINKKLNLDVDENVRILLPEDILAIINELIVFRHKEGREQDCIDHLENRRIRSAGELMQNQVRTASIRLNRTVSEKLNYLEGDPFLSLSFFVNFQSFNATLREFFNTNPLSQFLDQTNPLAELTHKRKISVRGPGGITGDRVSLAMRDIHISQYGRICPIETPEGQNAGLVTSLAIYARVNSHGFIESPFYRVKNGRVYNKGFPDYLTALEEELHRVSPGDVIIDSEGLIISDAVTIRYGEEIIEVSPDEVDYLSLSPMQPFSLGVCLIPFVEHNDGNRALMGSNMQRQSVPLLYPEAPLIGTGWEAQTAQDSGAMVVSGSIGKVRNINLNKNQICVQDRNGKLINFGLRKYEASNQETCINQQPLVNINEKVITGQVLADGTATQGGELAVGQNLLIAYMPWEGYNFEDSFVISERLVYDDVFTSIHIEEFKAQVYETNTGYEETTRNLPRTDESLIRKLDENGIVKIGTWVEPGDILVGKIVPKDPAKYSPEERLVLSILGRLREPRFRNTSFRMPYGMKGISGRVVKIEHFSRKNGDALGPGILESFIIHVVEKRKIQIGDKVAGRHGNKGVISKILPRQDMPFLPNGRPVDILLNPLGVPSRMNVGQLYDALLGLAASRLMSRFRVIPFDETQGPQASRGLINKNLSLAADQTGESWLYTEDYPGKMMLRDGMTGRYYDNPITVGVAYMLKLVHQVEDKLHARAERGPYAAVTQQPVGGRAQGGGQRLGEMEVWALEAFGAAYNLRELLTIKSDDMSTRREIVECILEGRPTPKPGIPESLKLLMRELQALCLDISTHKIGIENDSETDILN